jgi:lincosamide nucleotidyltransferase
MMPQEQMIVQLDNMCRQDQRVVAAMLYGSFTCGEADQYSD